MTIYHSSPGHSHTHNTIVIDRVIHGSTQVASLLQFHRKFDRNYTFTEPDVPWMAMAKETFQKFRASYTKIHFQDKMKNGKQNIVLFNAVRK